MSKRILVVDDSDTDRHLSSRVIQKLGHEVFEAVNGEDGVEKAKQLLPDLIIMDVVMPKMDGLSAVRALRKDDTTKNIPVIICSSKNQNNDIAWGKAQGAREYVTKPINPNVLAQKIIAVLGQ